MCCILNGSNAMTLAIRSQQKSKNSIFEEEFSSSNRPNFSSIGSFVLGKKRLFRLIDLADSRREQSKPLDKFSVCNLVNVTRVKNDGKQILEDGFSVIKS